MTQVARGLVTLVLVLGALGITGALTVDATDRALAVIPGGTNILHVPMSWCIVNGAPAAVSPNVKSEGTNVTDTNTDGVIWRRHERPTDNIYIPQASISLRSSINDSWGALTFPLINDPDTAVGQLGDVQAALSRTPEIVALDNACDAAYAAMGRAGIGITAININLWRTASGGYTGQTGLGGCTYSGAAGSPCTSDFWILAIDNHYLYPTVANRSIPGFGTLNADPFDLVVAHETGHALSLSHRTDTTAMMNPSAVDTNGDQRVDNIGLNASEVAMLRASAANVPGLEIDPVGNFQPGTVLAMRQVDGRREVALAPHLDLAALTLTLRTRSNTVDLSQRLWGLLPCKSLRPTVYGALADLDNKASTGASLGALSSLHLSPRFRGADLILTATVTGGNRPGREFQTCRSRVRAWIATSGGKIVPLRPGTVVSQIQTMRIFPPHFPAPPGHVARELQTVDVFNSILVTLQNGSLPIKFRPKVPVRLYAFVTVGGRARDQLGVVDRGVRFVLEQPRFPHCAPAGPVKPGGTVVVRFDGLAPAREIHALIGPNEVLRGVRTDANGEGRIRLPIPANTRRGNHLVTIGHDGLALTADCTLTVQ